MIAVCPVCDGSGLLLNSICPLCEGKKKAIQLRPRSLIGFDFDCTLTIRHFYKVFAWGYAQGNNHKHYEDFAEWCENRGLPTYMKKSVPYDEDPVCAAVEDFCHRAGRDAFRELFREVFLGGDARITATAAWLERLRCQENCEFAIVTAGVSAAVLQGLAAVPEWLPHFPASRVWDTSQGRHQVHGTMDQKALICRDLAPEAPRILLVDDSSSRDPVPPWVLAAAGVQVYEGPLPYEGPGIQEAERMAVEEALLR